MNTGVADNPLHGVVHTTVESSHEDTNDLDDDDEKEKKEEAEDKEKYGLGRKRKPKDETDEGIRSYCSMDTQGYHYGVRERYASPGFQQKSKAGANKRFSGHTSKSQRDKVEANKSFSVNKSYLLSKFNINVPRIPIPSKEEYIKQALKPDISLIPSIKYIHAGATAEGLVRMIDTFDRPATVSSDSMFARKEKYNEGMVNEHGKRLPKKGAYAEAAVAEATAAYRICDAKAKLLYAEADVGISVMGFYAMATAGLATVSFNGGPFGVKVGLSLDAGASFGLDGVGLHFLGMGFNIGPTTSVSFFGNELTLKLL